MVTVGLAEGLAEVEVNPAGELTHEYVLPATDAAPMDMLEPVQIAVLDITEAEGRGLTVTVTELDLLQPVAVIVSVKV